MPPTPRPPLNPPELAPARDVRPWRARLRWVDPGAWSCLALLALGVGAGAWASLRPPETSPPVARAAPLPTAGEALQQVRRRALDPFEIRAQRPVAAAVAPPPPKPAPERPVWSSPPGDPRGHTEVLAGLPPREAAAPPPFAAPAHRPGGPQGPTSTGDQPRSEVPLTATLESWQAARAALRSDRLPPAAAVLPESFLRAFPHADPAPPAGAPLALTAELAPDPFAPGWHALRVAARGGELPGERPDQHLIVVVDGSGSMGLDGRLPAARRAVQALAGGLGPRDRLALISFAEQAEVLLPPGRHSPEAVDRALAQLTADGPSDLDAGLAAAWRLAPALPRTGARRVVLLTDGEPNVGLDRGPLWRKTAAAWHTAGVSLVLAQVGDGRPPGPVLSQLAAAAGGPVLPLSTAPRDAAELADALLEPAAVSAEEARMVVTFSPSRVRRWTRVGWAGEAATPPLDRFPAGHSRAALYRVELLPGDAPIAEVEVRARRVDGRPWTHRLRVTDALRRDDLAAAGGGLRMAWAAATFAEQLRGDRPGSLSALADHLDHLRRPGVHQDLELLRLVQRAALLQARPRLAASATPAVRDAVARQVEQAHYCAAEARQSQPTLTAALDLELRVFAGRVTEATLLRDAGDAELAACVRRKALQWQFPADLDADVVVPIRSRPAALARR